MTPREFAWSKFKRSKTALVSLFVVFLYLAAAVGFEIHGALCHRNMTVPVYAQTSEKRFSPPSKEHWLGTDYQGRDVLLRSLAGSATAMKIGVISGSIAVFIFLF
jgi:peptide/nickel transport system permease protein